MYSKRKMRVLVVENDPSVRNFVSQSLGEGFEIIPAGTLADAKVCYSHRKPDAILVDLDLPCSKGLATLDALQVYCDDVPSVVFSGAGDAADSLLRGAQYFVDKDDNSIQRLHVIVAKAIARHVSRHEYDNARAKISDNDAELDGIRHLLITTTRNCGRKSLGHWRQW